MGAFFTNIQVHTGGLPPEFARERLQSGIRERMAGLGLVEARPGEALSHRLLIAPASSAPWLAVYDEATESQNETAMEASVSLLSAALLGTAVGVRVHDSDVLDLWLGRAGTLDDHFCSWPDFPEGDAPEPLRTDSLAGRPEAWKDLLVSGDLEALRQAWDAPLLQQDAAEILKRMAPLLEWPPDQVMTGYRGLSTVPRPGYTEMLFRPATGGR